MEKIDNVQETYWVVFTRDQLDQLPLDPSKRMLNVIFPGQLMDYPQYNVTNVLDSNTKCDDIFENLRDMFNKLSISYGGEIIGYLNNCFLCSVRLVSAYISTIEYILETNKNSIFMFLYGIKFPPKGPNYFLSEYESHASGIVLYNRAEVLTMILVNYCQYKGIACSFNTKPKISWQKVFNIMRIYIVWLGKFCISIKKSINHRKLDNKKKIETDVVFVTRSDAQTQILSNVLPKNGKKNTILVGCAFVEKNHYQTVKQYFKSDKEISVISIDSLKIGLIIKQYMIAFFKSFLVKRHYVEVHGFKVDVTQVIREILVSMPELVLYRVALEKTLENISVTDNLVFGTEMISPHAYVESTVAQVYSYDYIQLMTGDIERVSLPLPVTGHLFIPSTNKKYANLKLSWTEFQDKLFYPGRLVIQHPPLFLKRRFKICYFSSYYNTSLGKRIVDYLAEHVLKANERFLIKLHPRDQSSWYKSNPHAARFEVVRDKVSQVELFSLFDFALVGCSSVGTALLAAKKPFVFLDIHGSDDCSQVIIDNNVLDGLDYVDKLYPVRISRVTELDVWFQNEEKFLESFNQLYERIIVQSDRLVTAEGFIKEIENYIGRKRFTNE